MTRFFRSSPCDSLFPGLLSSFWSVTCTLPNMIMFTEKLSPQTSHLLLSSPPCLPSGHFGWSSDAESPLSSPRDTQVPALVLVLSSRLCRRDSGQILVSTSYPLTLWGREVGGIAGLFLFFNIKLTTLTVLKYIIEWHLVRSLWCSI